MQDGMDAVLDASAIRAQIGPLGALLAQAPGLTVRDPHSRQIAAAQQLRQGERVHFVGFDFGFGNGAGAQGIGNHHLPAEGLQERSYRPAVGCRFQRHRTVAQVLAGKVLNGFALRGNALPQNQVSILIHDGAFDFLFVYIESGEVHNEVTSSAGEQAAGLLRAKR